MKKVLFAIALVAATATVASCGGKTAKGGDNDSTAVADRDVITSSDELWTE